MQPSRIAELLAPFLESTAAARPSTQDLISSISTYIDILLRWNARINLTAIRDPEDIVTRHFGESLFAARHLFPFETDIGSASEPVTGQTRASEITGGRPGGIAGERAGGRAALQGRVNSREMSGASAPASANDQPPATNDHPTVADIGSGPGFPGLPIKLWAPHISLTLIESNHKKAAFLKEVTRALTLTDVNIQNARAETTKDSYDLVTLRAVERFEAILPTAAALVNPSGRLALLISSAQEPQARTALSDLQWSPPIPIPKSRSRVLALGHRP